MKQSVFSASEASNLLIAASKLREDGDSSRFLLLAEKIFIDKLEAKSEQERLLNLK